MSNEWADVPAPVLPVDDEWSIGAVVATHFRLDECVSVTQHALVYRVTDIDTGDPRVLKRSRGGRARLPDLPDLPAMLEQEAVLTAQVAHSAAVRVHEVGRLPSGDAFYITDWIDGEAVDRILVRGPLRVHDALGVVLGITPALTLLHGLGHVHRDIKPHNIIVPRQPGGLNYLAATLIDFGNQRRLSLSRRGELRAFAGRISGTLRYMAPEQFLGQAESVATDVYGLGVTLFAMLFGRSVRSLTDIRRARSADGIGPRVFVGPGIVRCLTTEIELPSEPHVDSRVRQFVSQMIRIDPRERPASMADVACEVEHMLAFATTNTRSSDPVNASMP
jgi:serine/threonine protein kinase